MAAAASGGATDSGYLDHVERQQGLPFADFWEYGDPAYALMNWFGGNVWGHIYLVNTVSALLFCWGLLAFCRSQPRPWLVLAVSMPYLVIVVAMGYTRQGVAIGFAMLSIVALLRGYFWRFIGWISVAALFHKSAAVLVPIALFSAGERRWLKLVGVVITGVLLFLLLVQEAVDVLVAGYIEAEYQSAGAGIRIGMNALAALAFLIVRKRLVLPRHVRSFWTWMSLSSLLFVALLLISPSSTAVDRVALYWIPLQLFVWGRLPDALGRPHRKNQTLVLGVLSYSAAVLFTWLFFSDHSSDWIPYQFYPLQWL